MIKTILVWIRECLATRLMNTGLSHGESQFGLLESNVSEVQGGQNVVQIAAWQSESAILSFGIGTKVKAVKWQNLLERRRTADFSDVSEVDAIPKWPSRYSNNAEEPDLIYHIVGMVK